MAWHGRALHPIRVECSADRCVRDMDIFPLQVEVHIRTYPHTPSQPWASRGSGGPVPCLRRRGTMSHHARKQNSLKRLVRADGVRGTSEYCTYLQQQAVRIQVQHKLVRRQRVRLRHHAGAHADTDADIQNSGQMWQQ